MGAENFGGSDFAAYRQNAALLQRQQAPIAPYVSEGALSPINPFAGRMAGDPTASFMSQRRSPMPPIQYKRIIRKPKSTYEEQVKEIDQLVTRLDDDKQGLYRQFMNENDEREQKHRDRIHSNVAQMSESAQQQFAKISALLRNPALPNEERWARVLSLYGQMDGELRQEFEKKFANFGVGI
ncbi:DUF148 domain-containing protein [Aphelenchoides fujianensis]|nr:DUF148 domain-containing protein [Aphelenchoides fujianensis]